MGKSNKFFVIRIMFLLFYSFAFLSIGVTAQSPVAQTECEVNGTFTDQYGAIVLGVVVSYMNFNIRKTAKADAAGKYSLKLPHGVYEISITRGASKARYQRAKIAISCVEDIQITVVLLPECVSFGCQRAGYSFATFAKSWTLRSDLNMVIAYDKKTKFRGRALYDHAVLTFDTYTLSADKIIQDFKSKRIFAEGRVWIENGMHRSNFDKLTMRFTNDGIRIDGK